MKIEKEVRSRAAVHAALGDPARLSIADALALGDASPGELAVRMRMPSNLLAHHLNVLDVAGVVERKRSEGDRRRTYVRLLPAALAMVAVGQVSAPRVVFVCTHNSARSQLAAVLWQQRSEVPATSAGTRPAGRVHPAAVATARRHGLRLARARTAGVGDVLRGDDLVVTVCDHAFEELHGVAEVHWSVPDPVRAGTDDAFDRAFEQITERVGRLAGAVNIVEKDTS